MKLLKDVITPLCNYEASGDHKNRQHIIEWGILRVLSTKYP